MLKGSNCPNANCFLSPSTERRVPSSDAQTRARTKPESAVLFGYSPANQQGTGTTTLEGSASGAPPLPFPCFAGPTNRKLTLRSFQKATGDPVGALLTGFEHRLRRTMYVASEGNPFRTHSTGPEGSRIPRIHLGQQDHVYQQACGVPSQLPFREFRFTPNPEGHSLPGFVFFSKIWVVFLLAFFKTQPRRGPQKNDRPSDL